MSFHAVLRSSSSSSSGQTNLALPPVAGPIIITQQGPNVGKMEGFKVQSTGRDYDRLADSLGRKATGTEKKKEWVDRRGASFAWTPR